MIRLLNAYKTKRIQIVCADMPKFITNVSQQGIEIYNITPVNELTWEFDVSADHYLKINNMIENTGGQAKVIRISGIGTYLERAKKRPILAFLILFILGLTIILPNWIFFVQVEGNNRVPTQLILETANKAGVGFGSYRRGIRSEKIKNSMLTSISELSWVGVNTSGCVAKISVQEGMPIHQKENKTQVCSIVASRDGIVSELTVLRGSPLCSVGSAVKRGDVLISGYTDSGLLIRAEAASGEVFAKTKHQFTVISDTNALVRHEKREENHTYWFFVGKKLLKLWKDSGISGASCVKMYKLKHLTLPGGFQLPIGILIQTEIPYTCNTQNLESLPWLEARCQDYLLTQMNAGRIQGGYILPVVLDDLISAECNYTCQEMIGQVRYEETVTDYGKSD